MLARQPHQPARGGARSRRRGSAQACLTTNPADWPVNSQNSSTRLERGVSPTGSAGFRIGFLLHRPAGNVAVQQLDARLWPRATSGRPVVCTPPEWICDVETPTAMKKIHGPEHPQRSLAVLIDADNTSPKWAETLIQGNRDARRIARQRQHSSRDFSGSRLRSWENAVAGLAILQPSAVVRLPRGTPPRDITMVIDAVESHARLPALRRVLSWCLPTAIFSRLASRIREQRLQCVSRIGKQNTPDCVLSQRVQKIHPCRGLCSPMLGRASYSRMRDFGLIGSD